MAYIALIPLSGSSESANEEVGRQKQGKPRKGSIHTFGMNPPHQIAKYLIIYTTCMSSSPPRYCRSFLSPPKRSLTPSDPCLSALPSEFPSVSIP